MNLCSYGHDEICHETRHCPCCVIIADKDTEIHQLQGENSTLESKVSTLESELGDANDTISRLDRQVEEF